VWGVQKTAPCAHVIRAHDGPVMGLSLHATGDYLLSCSSDAVSMHCHVDDVSDPPTIHADIYYQLFAALCWFLVDKED